MTFTQSKMAASLLLQLHPASRNILDQIALNFFHTGHLEVEGTCHIWQGRFKKKSKKKTSRYPIHTFRYLITENGVTRRKRADHYVQHVVWFLRHGTVPVKDALEVSHLCHDSRCLNVAHLTLEPGDINKERYRKCVKDGQRLCQGHPGFLDCIFN